MLANIQSNTANYLLLIIILTLTVFGWVLANLCVLHTQQDGLYF
jgi:hypothetical protein